MLQHGDWNRKHEFVYYFSTETWLANLFFHLHEAMRFHLQTLKTGVRDTSDSSKKVSLAIQILFFIKEQYIMPLKLYILNNPVISLKNIIATTLQN